MVGFLAIKVSGLISEYRKKYRKDSRTWTQRILKSERKWTAQLDDLAAAYLVWKDGSSTLRTTDEEFTVQYIDIFGKYC